MLSCVRLLVAVVLVMLGGSYLSERLSHLPQEVLGKLHGLVHGEVQTAVVDVLLYPAG